MNSRGTYGSSQRTVQRAGSPRAWVGITLFHTVGDRDRLVEQIDTEFGQLISELFRKMGADPALLNMSEVHRDPMGWSKRYQAAEQTIKRSPIYPLWKDTVMPVWNEWKNFYKEQSSWEEWKTNWDTYENWRDRIAKLHAHVVSEVGRLMPDQPIRTPPPTGAPQTIWAEAGEATAGGLRTVGGGIGDVLHFLKIAAYAGLAIGGVYVVSRVVQSGRSARR